MISIAGGEDVAGPPGLKSPEVELGRALGARPRRGRRDALRLVRRGIAGARRSSTGSGSRAWARAASSRSTRRRPSRAPAPAWSTASSCSATCCTPTWSTRRATSASPRSGRRPAISATCSMREPAIETTAIAAIASSSIGQAPRAPACRARRRRSPGRRARPPTRPPRWPPMLIPRTAEGDRQVEHAGSRRSRRRARRCRGRGRSRRSRRRSRRPRPEAPIVSASGLSRHRAEGAGEERGEVEGDEARRADPRLEHAPEEVEGEHVEADVDQAGVEEAAGQQPVPLAFGDRGPEQAEVDRSASCRSGSSPPPPPAISARKTTTLSAIRTKVAGAVRAARRRRAPASPGSAAGRTPGSACRPGSASCTPGRSAARRRSRKRRSRGRDVGSRSRPSRLRSLQSPADGRHPARPPLRDPRRAPC